MNTCIIIPVYNHEQAIVPLLTKLRGHGLPCILVNDGSSAACSQVLADCARRQEDWLTLIERPCNGGKGAAMTNGFAAAMLRGYSHAIQIDADDQHDAADITEFLRLSAQHPEAMILGRPRFAADAPRNRRYGREFANLWVWINTLSLSIRDGLCGFRLYPLAAVAMLMNRRAIADGMDFDIDIVVRLHWQGVEAINLPTKVRYPSDGVSHFKLWRDNLLITRTHALLFIGMWPRIGQLLGRHW